MAKRFIHDPECAMSRDIAPTADWDDSKYKPPACTCAERQRARGRVVSHTTGNGMRGASEGDQIGEGCYRRPISRGGY